MGRITVVSGIRNLGDESIADVDLAVIDALIDTDEMRFGGALGVDTVALSAAHEAAETTFLRVFVPAKLSDQPSAAVRVIRRCASEVVELGYPLTKAAFLRRNDRMLEGAQRLVAFTDGRTTGGTAYTIQRAKAKGLDVELVQVVASKVRNPKLHIPDAPAPIFAMESYQSSEWASSTIRALKAGAANALNVDRLAREVASYILSEPELREARCLIPMPRRDPKLPSDLLDLAEAIARRTRQDVIDNWLVRTALPAGGFVAHSRTRFPPAEHEATLAVQGDDACGRVLLLDNVLTTRGTMVGAQRAVLRDTGTAPVGLAVLYSLSAEAERRTRRR